MARMQGKFVTPPSIPDKRLDANYVVNAGIRKGWYSRPACCCKCGRSACRIEGHHEDYNKPASVHWLCHGCHMRAHLNPGFLAGIEPFICEDKRALAVIAAQSAAMKEA